MRNSGSTRRESSLTMKMCLLLVFLFSANVWAVGQPPEKISMKLSNVSLESFFDAVSSRAGVSIKYDAGILTGARKVSVSATEESWAAVVRKTIEPLGYSLEVSGKTGYVTKRAAAKGAITGVVIDDLKEPLIGVNVRIKERPSVGVTTNMDGVFAINATETETLVFTYIGMATKEVKLQKGITSYNVTMAPDKELELEEVVVEAGIIQRDKLGFTGSFRTVGKEELKTVSGTNVLQSLSTLDPSFSIMTNNLAGSNPNVLANISMRGGSTMNFKTEIDDYSSNPNEPLFVLDGFETSLQVVNDLDINRIESITLLKDAGSTAIYGSKGANGVVVIETIKPKEGQIMVDYGGNLEISWADLSDYNMMNAREKVEFEALAGRYGNLADFNGNQSGITEYNANKARLAEGIDTYWLKMPLKTGVTHSHSLNISGGSKELLYQVGVNYKKDDGVMKDSYHESFGGNMRITYRKDKLNISNNLTVSVANSYDGAWGSFSDFANANPYYARENEDGTIPQVLDKIEKYYTGSGKGDVRSSAYNPYYNAMLLSRSDANSVMITNNTSFDWFITERLRWKNSLSINTSNSDNVATKDPRHTSFIDLDYTKQGTYSASSGNNWGYNANTSLSYSHIIKDAHNFTFIGRASIDEKNKETKGFTAEGFPQGVEIYPNFAHGYTEDGRPSFSQTTTRMVSFLAALNYNYKYRYLFDFNYTIDGSSAFGSKKQFQDFYNFGLGWNLHKEAFAEGWEDNLLQEFKITGSYGINGNQNVSNVSENVYLYYTGNEVFGTGSYMSQFANPYLKWQVAKKLTGSLNFTMLKKRLNVNFELYKTATDPLVIALQQRLSSGIGSYPVNIGELETKGYEFRINYYFIRNVKDNIMLSASLTGGSYKSTYEGFDERLNQLNEKYADAATEAGEDAKQSLNSLIYYSNGSEPTTLWAVRSLGIDPATGREVFLTKNGDTTFSYNADDRVAVGNSIDKIKGVLGVNLTYKKLIVNAFFRYRYGAKNFNRALYRKVENLGLSDLVKNQDKRALYDRWKNPGDIAQYKNIDLNAASNTPISSRYIQKDNEFSGESIKLSWDFSKDAWIKKFFLKDLSVNISMRDIFLCRSMKEERGLDYPFKRSISAGLSARF